MERLYLIILLFTLCLHAEYDWSAIDHLMEDSIADHAFPGSVILIADTSKVLYRKAFGYYTYDEEIEMKMDTLFDLASVTKVLATTTATALLYQENLLNLNDKVTKYFPDFAQSGKSEITIENLLLHNSGFPPDPWPVYNSKDFGCPETSKSDPALSYSCFSQIYEDRKSLLPTSRFLHL
jgi:serine-type D-Ala-D-Ala carboxypeptidase